MALIDERGRLFGRINLIDAAVGLFVLVLIPLGYGAFVLFRTPVPTIASITPAQITEKQAATLEVVGTDLRPFMKAHLGRFEASAFAVQSPTKADIKVPDGIPAGTYDLILSDEAQELVRKPGAVTVVAPVPAAVTAQVQLVGEFVSLTPDLARTVRAGVALKGSQADASDQVLAVRPAQAAVRSVTIGPDQVVLVPVPNQVRVPAIVRVTCAIVENRCTVGGVAVAPESTVSLALSPSGGPAAAPASTLAFHVTATRSAETPAAFAAATLRVRFVARAEVVQALKAGDMDLAAPGAIGDAERAVLTAVDAERQSVSAMANVTVAPGQTYQVPQPAVAFTATVRVPVVATASGWQYKNKAIKVGAPFSFETVSGFVQGWIAEMAAVPSIGAGWR